MTTTTTLQVMKGLPYQLRVRAVGKEDYTQNVSFAEDDTISVSMTAYTGLDMDYETSVQSADKVDFSGTVLPWKWQYSTTLTTDRYCLMPIGQNYEHVLGPTQLSSLLSKGGNDIPDLVIDSNYIITGFQYGNYLQKSSLNQNAKTLIFSYITEPMESQRGNNKTLVTGVFNLSITTGKPKFWNDNTSGWQNLFTCNNSTKYWIKVVSDGTGNLTFSHSTDGSTYIQDWTGFVGSNKTYTDFSYMGGSPSDSKVYGSFDLKDCKTLDADGNVLWTAVESPEETLPGCTYNFEDDGSATTLNCFAVNGDESIVLTPDNSYNIPAQQEGFWQGSFSFNNDAEIYNGYLVVFNSNYENIWAWDKTYNIIGNPSISTDSEGNVTVVVSPGNYIETKESFNPQDNGWEGGFYCVYHHTGQNQILLSSKGFEVGVDDYAHPYATFYGITTLIANDLTLSDNDYVQIVFAYNDGEYSLIVYPGDGGAPIAEVTAQSGSTIQSGIINFGSRVSGERKSGWLLGTVSIPAHTVYEYDNGVWTAV